MLSGYADSRFNIYPHVETFVPLFLAECVLIEQVEGASLLLIHCSKWVLIFSLGKHRLFDQLEKSQQIVRFTYSGPVRVMMLHLVQ